MGKYLTAAFPVNNLRPEQQVCTGSKQSLKLNALLCSCSVRSTTHKVVTHVGVENALVRVLILLLVTDIYTDYRKKFL